MLRYHLLAFASQQVDSLSWHQLIAAGYGLVDNRDGLRKRGAYNIYKYMVHTLKNSQFLRLDIKRGHHTLQCLLENDELLQIHWSLQPKTIKSEDIFRTFSSSGEKIEGEFLKIGASPLYIFIK